MIERLFEAERAALSDIGDGRPPIVVVGDDIVAVGDATAAVETLGGRIAATLSIAGAVDGLVARCDPAVVLVELGADGSGVEDRMLDRLDLIARDRGTPCIVSFPLARLDAVAARIDARSSVLLCDPTRSDRVAALGLTRTGGLAHVAEADGGADAMRLQRLADEVGRIAKALSELAEHAPTPPPLSGFSGTMIGYRVEPVQLRAEPAKVSSADVRGAIRLRRLRDRYFDRELFADPVWDMLLDLTAARMERLRVAVSSLCIASAVPPTTALRWIKTMTDLGLIVRIDDPHDGRRVFIELSETAAKGMLGWFTEARRTGAAFG